LGRIKEKASIWLVKGHRASVEKKFVRLLKHWGDQQVWITTYPPFVMGYVILLPATGFVGPELRSVVRPLRILAEYKEDVDDPLVRRQKVYCLATLPASQAIRFVGRLSSIGRWKLVPGMRVRILSLGSLEGVVLSINNEEVVLEVTILRRRKILNLKTSMLVAGLKSGDVRVVH
jgi:hypothetical protein